MAALGKERNEVSKYINTLKKSGANTKLNDTFTIKPQKNKIDKNKKDDKEKITATQKLADEIARLTSYKIELESLNTSMNSFRTIIDTLGPNAKIAGESVATIMDKKSKTQIEKGLEVIRKSRKAIFIAQQQLNKKGITPEERKNWQVALQAGTQQLGLATQTLNAGIENSLAPLEKQGDIIKSNSNLLEQQLEVSKAVYGTPALAVQAIQNLVQNKEKERQITLKQIAEQQQNIEIMRATGATEEQLAVQVQKKVDLQKKATEQQAQQLQLVKELRDGYIDAVRAQAFGAGMFSKILITQDQNLMRGLQQKAIKRNYLLGQYGEESAKTMAKSYRFSAQGMGLLETKKGQVLSPSGAKKLGDTRIEGIADPVARNAARQATNAALRITGGPQSSINTYTQRGLGGAGALGLGKGTNPAGQTAFGAAINRGADPRLKGTLTLTSVSSESSLNKQGAVLKDTFNKVGKFLESLLIEIGKQRADQMNMNESRIGATTNNQDN